MIKKVKLMKGAFVEVRFDEKSGEFKTYVNFDEKYGCLYTGFLYKCKNCGKLVLNPAYNGKPQLNFCSACLEEMKNVLGYNKTEGILTNTSNMGDTEMEKAIASRGRVNKKVVKATKISIVVPEIQKYLDLIAGTSTKRFTKKFILFILELIARKKTRNEMAKILNISDHTMYCYLHDMRKVALIDTNDFKTYSILPTYYIKEE